MMPLPPLSSAQVAASSPDNHLESENRNLKRKLKDMQDGGKNGKGKGKGKNKKGSKGKNKGAEVITSMIGKSRTTSAGEPICFNFNGHGCPNAKEGARCKNGWHVCAEPNCGKPHSMQNHH